MAEKKQLDQQFYYKGADSDTNPELVQTEKGRYVDAVNMRPNSVDGNSGALQKIGGEITTHDFSSSYPGYTCIGATNCKGYKIGFFSKDGAASIMTVDGIVMVESSDFPTTYDHPLQIDVNENCKGGEIFFTDFNVEPMTFDLQDVIDNYNAGTGKYFDSFNINLFTVTLKRQLDIPVFEELTEVGANLGLRAGQYAYSLRYVDPSGNATQWSMYTPLIPVIDQDTDNFSGSTIAFSGTHSIYPNRTVKGNITVWTAWGIKLKYRVNNENNYSYVEFKRIRYSSQTLGALPTPKKYSVQIPLVEGQNSIESFEDNFSKNNDWEILTDEESTETYNVMEKAKAVRYYDNRLFFMNIKYSSKDLEDSNIEFLESPSNQTMYAFKHRFGSPTSTMNGRIGHKDPYNSTYYKHYMNGEIYGFALLAFDANGERSFVLPIENNSSYELKIPNRRHRVSGDSDTASISQWKGAPYAVDIDNNTNVPTFDVSNIDNNTYTYPDGSTYSYAPWRKEFLSGSARGIGSDSYVPLRPKSQEDEIETEHHLLINNQVIAPTTGATTSYRPYGFTPEYYATGVAVHGVKNLPDWVESFSIVRTKPAGRVIAQGLATYHNKSFTISSTDFTKKDTSKVKFVSDDVNFYGLSDSEISDYQMQFVAPLGVFSEVYSGYKGSLLIDPYNPYYPLSTGAWDRGVDLISYARLSHNTSNIIPFALDSNSAMGYWTQYGVWRNATTTNPFNTDGDKLFDITATTRPLESGRGNYLSISLGDNLYEYENLISNANINHTDSLKANEPVYIANIVNDNAELPDLNIDAYIETGHYQKMTSVIGKYDGTVNSFYLVDERIEDCAPLPYRTDRDDFNSIIYIQDDATDLKQAWLNITYKSSGDITTILTDITNNGYYVADMGSGVTENIYGVYKHVYSERNPYIYFEQQGTYSVSFCFPSNKDKIIVEYDNRIPLKVFGGDAWIGETIACTVDCEYKDNGKPLNSTNEYASFQGLPYYGYDWNAGYNRLKDAKDGSSTYLSGETKLEFLRQHIWMYTVESRAHLPYIFESNINPTTDTIYRVFPNTHYIMRPVKWDDSSESANRSDGAGCVAPTYFDTDYPGEWELWKYGGFKFYNQIDLSATGVCNAAYSQWNSDSNAFTKPAVGYEDKNEFCTAVIWSEQREINVQDDPNLRTFQAGNVKYLSDAYGAIKYAYDADTSKGNNLYAITNNGVCLLMTNKNQLTDAIGNTVAFSTPLDNYIQSEIWLSKDIGMNDEMWRTAAEWKKTLFFANEISAFTLFDNQIKDIAKDNKYYKRVWGDGLSLVDSGYTTPVCAIVDKKNEEYWLNILHTNESVNVVDEVYVLGSWTPFPAYITYDGTSSMLWNNYVLNDTYVYRLNFINSGGIVRLLGEQGGSFATNAVIYISNESSVSVEIRTDTSIISTMTAGASAKFTYNGSNSWTADADSTIPLYNETFVYGMNNEAWYGTYEYKAEKFISLGDTTYSVRDSVIRELDSGYILNGTTMACSVTNVSAQNQRMGKEFVDIKIDSDVIPTQVDFSTLISGNSQCYLNSTMSMTGGSPNHYYLKNYNGWYNYLPRIRETDQSTRLRLQGRFLYHTIKHSTAEDFNIVDTVIGSKILKIN